MQSRRSQFSAAFLWAVVALGAVIVCAGAEHAVAQRANRPARVECSGTVKEMLGGAMHIITDKDEHWWFRFSPNIVFNEDVEITGEADPTFAKAGMVVRMSAKVNTKKNSFIDPVNSFEIISLRPGIEPGIQNENEPKEGDDLFTNKPTSKKKEKLPEEMTATIVGTLGAAKTGKITVNVPRSKPVKGEMTQDCKITVNVADPAFIRVGDKVTIQGNYYEAEGPNGDAAGKGFIEKINVVAAEKFEPIKPQKGGKPYGNKPGSDKPGADDEADEEKEKEKKGAGKPGKAEKSEKPEVDPKPDETP